MGKSRQCTYTREGTRVLRHSLLSSMESHSRAMKLKSVCDLVTLQLPVKEAMDRGVGTNLATGTYILRTQGNLDFCVW